MQHPSPALSSPSTGFLGPRVSPLFSSAVDQSSDVVINSTDLFRSSMDVTRSSEDQEKQAPPKKLSRAMEGLAKAHRYIADVRSGADLILEVLELAVGRRVRESSDKKASDGMAAAAESMRRAIDGLRAIGRELDSSGILKGAQQRYEDNQPWGLQPPSVCPDGHVTPYAWKRQIAGQAAASAVERTRLALKSFGEQKKHLFLGVQDEGPRSKRSRTGIGHVGENAPLADVLRVVHIDAPGMIVTPYTRLEWAKRTSIVNISKIVSDPGHSGASAAQALNTVKQESGAVSLLPGSDSSSTSKPVAFEKVAILEVTIPGVLRAIVSLQPTGSTCPDAISVFSPDESGGYVHAWGKSQHKLHQRISEHGVNALHYFRRNFLSASLKHLLLWINTYRTLFSEACNECKRMTALDAPSDLLLPPLVRLFHHLALPKPSVPGRSDSKSEVELSAFHIGCIPKKELEAL